MKKTISYLFTLLIFQILISTYSFGQSAYTKLCLEGIQFENNNDLVNAKIKYTQAISINPNGFQAYNFRGKVSFKLSEYENTVLDMTNAIKMNPKEYSSYNVRARANSYLNNYSESIKDYTYLISVLPKKNSLFTTSVERRAFCYYKNKQYENAIYEYTQMINSKLIKGENVEIYWYQFRSCALFKTQKYTESIADFEIILNKYPESSQYVYLEGLAYFNNGNSTQATKLVERYLLLEPIKSNYYSTSNLLNIYNFENNILQADKQFESIQNNLLEVQKIPSENLKNIEITTIFNELNELWQKNIIRFQEDEMRADSIKQYMFKVYALLKEKPTISEEARKLIVQATTATTEKNYGKAINLYTKSLSIEPCNHLAYYNLALLFANQDLFSKAIENMQIYIQLYPNSSDVRAAKDKIYEWEGKIPKTVKSNSDPELSNNLEDPRHEKNANFMLAYGITQPKGNTGLFDANESIESRFFSSGKIGMKNGFFIETGVSINPSSLESKKNRIVHFLFEPVNLRYSQNQIDWSKAGGIYVNRSAYTKDFRMLEFGEKFGIRIDPIPHLFLSFYYKPAFVMNAFQTEISQKQGENEWNLINTDGISYIRLSNTLGFSIRYYALSVGYEFYSANLKYDLRNYYHDSTIENTTGFDKTTTGKTLIKFGTFRIALYL